MTGKIAGFLFDLTYAIEIWYCLVQEVLTMEGFIIGAVLVVLGLIYWAIVANPRLESSPPSSTPNAEPDNNKKKNDDEDDNTGSIGIDPLDGSVTIGIGGGVKIDTDGSGIKFF